MKKAKKLLIWFGIYYFVGFILINLFTLSRFIQSGNILESGPQLIAQNLSTQAIYILSLGWPLYFGFQIYNFFTAGRF